MACDSFTILENESVDVNSLKDNMLVQGYNL